MPFNQSHAVSLKEIADAVKAIKEKSWVVNVTTPPITLSPIINVPQIQVVVQQIDEAALAGIGTAIGNAVTAAVNAALSQITIAPQITMEGGSGGDCGCGGGSGLSELVCILAPVAASQIKANQAHISLAEKSGFWTETNSKQWPDERDADPPLAYTMPLDGGIPPFGFDYPPGGANGGSDPDVYSGYRCDVANYIVDYLINYYKSMAEFSHEASDMLGYLSMLRDAQKMYAAVSARMAAKEIVYNVVSTGANMGAKTLIKDAVEVSFIEVAVLFEVLIAALSFLTQQMGNVLDEHVAYLETRRKALVCGLLKGEKSYESVDLMNKAAAKFWKPTVDVGQGYAWAGINSKIISPLADNLFACKAGYDFSAIDGFGSEMGGCDSCSFDCGGATLVQDFNNGKQGWRTVNPPTPDNTFGEALGKGIAMTSDNTPTGKLCFKKAGSITIENDTIRTFSQMCVLFGGDSPGYSAVKVYVNDILAFTGSGELQLLSAPDVSPAIYSVSNTISFNIENDLSAEGVALLTSDNSKIKGKVRVVRECLAGIAMGYGEARIFGVAFG